MQKYTRKMCSIKAHCHNVTLVPTRIVKVVWKASITKARKGFVEALNA